MGLMLSRRSFLKNGLVIAGAAGLPIPVWSRTRTTRLPIPRLIDTTSGDPFKMTIQAGSWSFLEGIQTPTLGINQGYLGPTLRTRKGAQLNLHYQNMIDEGVSIHGHGLHVPGVVDGGPQLEIPPQGIWQPSISIEQPAATCWYHSHTHGKSGVQTYRGLAGMTIIDDDETDAMDLPNRYGIDDLPIIIQDRTLDSQGALVYSLEDASEDGWYGETVFINGARSPFTKVPAGKVRLRILNGANARFYVLTFSDNRVFHKIASDGGLLESPVPLQTMEMAPGERCEIIVDLSDGKSTKLLTLFEDEVDEDGFGIISGLSSIFSDDDQYENAPALSLEVDQGLTANTAPLPDRLTSISRPDPKAIEVTREFILQMEGNDGHSSHSGHGYTSMGINGQSMNMSVINERVKKGVWERWRIRSDAGAHPFHVHGCSFLIENMEGEAAPDELRGWKDVVMVDDDGWSEFVVKFDYEATDEHPYMYHCHILEHEDMGMMGQFTVS